MADVQISQSGPFFPKISLLDAKCFDFAWLTDLFCPRCRSAKWKFAWCLYMVFPHQSSIGACQNLEGCVAFPRKPPNRIDVVSDITFACSDIIRPDLGTALIENYVDANVYVLVAFQEIQWQKDSLCPVTLKNIQHSNKLSLINFYRESKVEALNQPDCSSFWCNSFPLSHVSWMQNFQNYCRSVGFSPLTWSSLQQEMPEEEAVPLALVQVASEKQAAQHGPLLWMNIGGVKLETAHCLKLAQVGRTLRDCNFRSCSRIFSSHLVLTARASSESSGSIAVVSFTPPRYISL